MLAWGKKRKIEDSKEGKIWKRWKSNDATEFAEFDEGIPFELTIECSSLACGSGAISLVASFFLTVSVLSVCMLVSLFV